MIYFKIFDRDNNVVYNSIPPSLGNSLLQKGNNSLSDIVIDNVKIRYRYGFSKNEKGSIYILTDDKKYVNSKNTFKDFLNLNLLLIDSFYKMKTDIIEKYNNQTKELIHNLITLNGHNIQEVFALVPQQSLTKNINEQLKTIKGKITNDIEGAAKTFLRLAKNNMAMKIEFSVFNKLMENKPFLAKEEHNIRIIILNILQIFYQDFEDKGIKLQLDSSDVDLCLDFETITVCFYYIIENALKYCLPRTTLKIFLLESDGKFCVVFDMISLQIIQGEENQLCDFGFCGANAKKLGKNGSGIGLYRAYKTLILNDATIEIKPRTSLEYQKKHEGYIYEHNVIEIKFPLQKRWV
jgi:K+-sensing histidine kinase KdpD